MLPLLRCLGNGVAARLWEVLWVSARRAPDKGCKASDDSMSSRRWITAVSVCGQHGPPPPSLPRQSCSLPMSPFSPTYQSCSVTMYQFCLSTSIKLSVMICTYALILSSPTPTPNGQSCSVPMFPFCLTTPTPTPLPVCCVDWGGGGGF